MRILVPMAHGSESLEAVTIINLLRRAGLSVTVASIETETLVNATRDVHILADTAFADLAAQDYEAIILPGGERGAERLAAHAPLIAKLHSQRVAHRWYGAICAAPALTLSPHGLLDGKQATCYPTFRDRLLHFVDQPVVVDGHCITSQGPATALAFALTWVEKLVGIEERKRLSASLLLV